MALRVKPVRAIDPPDPWSGPQFTELDLKALAALADWDDGIDLALSVAAKKLDPKTAVAACVRTETMRLFITGQTPDPDQLELL